MGSLNIVLVSVLFAIVYAEVAVITPCDEGNEDVCKVTEVRITPCRWLAKSKACAFHVGKDAAISFDFTPSFSTSTLETMVYYAGVIDFEFSGFGNTDACTYTTCPTQAGQSQTFNYNLHLSKKLPKNLYLLKWKVWDKNNGTSLCCFKTNIKLV